MSDACFPRLHVRPAKGWINDPNGVCRVDGRWHVFFQYNPHSPRHHRVGWGHWSSPDLVAWTEHEPALMPTPNGLDAFGCWSGSFVMDGATPTMIYTAVADHARDAVGLVATGSADLVRWTPSAVASAPRHGGELDETRDPFSFELDGHRYVVQGFGGPSTPAALLVYDADDLSSWKPLGSLLEVTHPVAARVAEASIWECPNLVQVDGQWVLIVSLWRWDGAQGQLSGVRWMLGDLRTTPEGPRFEPHDGGVLDDGPAFYAPQAARTPDRVLLWGWSWELDRDEDWLDAHGWAGVLTTPRELRVRDGRLVQEPAAEYLTQRGAALDTSWAARDVPAFEVVCEAGGVLSCSGTEGGAGDVALPAGSRVLVDGSLVEVFHDGGTATTRVYPAQDSTWTVSGGTATALG